ncbi:hypothetical protein ABT237_13445 [Streptomyces sp. NPDC001581]|uniref:hypothetical protein n=1 Tax=Streptomyces sp. NPDC001581 TaxID=3154386 RepID=UPI003328DC1E
MGELRSPSSIGESHAAALGRTTGWCDTSSASQGQELTRVREAHLERANADLTVEALTHTAVESHHAEARVARVYAEERPETFGLLHARLRVLEERAATLDRSREALRDFVTSTARRR